MLHLPQKIEASEKRIADLTRKINAAEEKGRSAKANKQALEQAKRKLERLQQRQKEGSKVVGGEDTGKTVQNRREVIYDVGETKNGDPFIRTITEQGLPRMRLLKGKGQNSAINFIKRTGEPGPWTQQQVEAMAAGGVKSLSEAEYNVEGTKHTSARLSEAAKGMEELAKNPNLTPEARSLMDDLIHGNVSKRKVKRIEDMLENDPPALKQFCSIWGLNNDK